MWSIGTVIEIDPQQVYPDPRNERQVYTGIEELAEQIAQEGQRVAAQAYPDPSDPARLILEGGHRRRLACIQLGRPLRVEVIAPPADILEGDLRRLQNNLAQESLNDIEIALSLRRILDENRGQITQEELAKRAGLKSQAAVSNKLRLLKLPAEVQAMIADGRLTQGHGVALLKLLADKEFTEVLTWDRTYTNIIPENPPRTPLDVLLNLAGRVTDESVRETELRVERVLEDQRRLRSQRESMARKRAQEEKAKRELDAKLQARIDAGDPEAIITKQRADQHQEKENWHRATSARNTRRQNLRRPMVHRLIRQKLEWDRKAGPTLDHLRLVAYELVHARYRWFSSASDAEKYRVVGLPKLDVMEKRIASADLPALLNTIVDLSVAGLTPNEKADRVDGPGAAVKFAIETWGLDREITELLQEHDLQDEDEWHPGEARKVARVKDISEQAAAELERMVEESPAVEEQPSEPTPEQSAQAAQYERFLEWQAENPGGTLADFFAGSDEPAQPEPAPEPAPTNEISPISLLALRALGYLTEIAAPLTFMDIMRNCGGSPSDTHQALDTLVSAGHVRPLDPGARGKTWERFEVIREGQPVCEICNDARLVEDCGEVEDCGCADPGELTNFTEPAASLPTEEELRGRAGRTGICYVCGERMQKQRSVMDPSKWVYVCVNFSGAHRGLGAIPVIEAETQPD